MSPANGERREDRGLFGPDTVAWRVIGHPVALIGGMRALIVQSLHPLAMAGVAQHSDYRNRALARLRRTAAYVTATTFGDTETAHAAARVKAVHRRVRGIDPVTRRAYSAADPTPSCGSTASSGTRSSRSTAPTAAGSHRRSRTPTSPKGCASRRCSTFPRERVPASVDEMRAYFESVRPELCISEHAREAIDFVIHPPMTRELLPLQVPLRTVARAAVATVPRHLRALAGLEGPRSLDAVTVAAVRPAAAALTLPLLRDAPGLVLGAEVRAVRDAARALAVVPRNVGQ